MRKLFSLRLNTFLGASVTGLVALLRFTPSFPTAPVVLASCSVLVAVAPLGAATVEAKRSFDLPRGDAATTLRQFAASAGRSLVFVTDKVRGETTNAVRGEFTPREALERMLAGSALEAAQDAATGALVVSRKRTTETAPSKREVGPVSDPQTKPPVKPMKSTRTLLAALAGWLALGSAADAQTAKTSAKDEAIVLSPFTVNIDKDDGFVASSSFAGGRLAGELKDTPVAYSVLTKDFIEALNLTDLNKTMEWMPGTYLNDGDNNTRLGSTNDQNVVTIRGSQLNSPQRNFFPFAFNFDNFNVERMDQARGANAVLFGNGGFGGNPNSVSKRAQLTRSFGDLRFSYGSWANDRATLDVNVRAGDRFAVRANLMWTDNRAWREHDFLKRRGAAIAATWKISRWTELRAEAEHGRQTGNIALGHIADRLSGWDGVTTYTTRSAGANNAAGTTRYGTNGIAIYTPSTGENTLINYASMAQTQGGNASSAVPVGGQLLAGDSANINGSPILDALNLSDSRFSRAFANSSFRLPSREFSTSPDATTRQDISRVYTVGLTHQFGQSLFLDLTGNLSLVHKWGNPIATRGISDVYIDINRNLPTGAPNPKFLVPYSEANGNYRFPNDIDAKNLRAALGYVLNSPRWGSYKFNAVGGISRQKNYQGTYNYALARNTDPRFWPTDLLIRYRYYWDEASRPQATPSSWNFVDPISGQTNQVRADFFHNNALVAEQNYNYVLASTAAKFWKDRINFLGAVRRDVFETWRSDTIALRDNAMNWDGKTDVYRPAAPADYFALAFSPKDATGRITGSPGPALTRPRDANGFPLPQYSRDRFQDDYTAPKVPGKANNYTVGTVVHVTKWLSAFVNYGTTYNLPPISGLRLDRSVSPGVEASGWDYGLRFSLLNDRLVANLTRYSGDSVGYGRGAYNDSGATYINAILQARQIGESSNSAINARGVELLPPGFYDSSKGESDGYELELTANLTRSWRLLLNGSLLRRYNGQQNPESQAWLAGNDKLLRDILNDAGVTVATNNVAIVRPTASLDAPAAAVGWNNIQNVLASQSLNHVPAQDTSTANLFTDYQFREGRFKNLRVGGGFNFRGRRIIGNRSADTMVDPANPSAAIRDPKLTAMNSVFTPSYYTATATLSYSYRFNKTYTLLADLRVANLFNYDKAIYSTTALRPPGGNLSNPARTATPYMLNYLVPRSYTLSTTLKF